MIYYIYKITNNLNNKSYIGKRTSIKLPDSYMGSGTLLKLAYKRYGKENFTKEILEICDKEELNSKEIYWIETSNTVAPNGYNIHEGGQGGDNFTNNPNKKEILLKIAQISKTVNTGRKWTKAQYENRKTSHPKHITPTKRISCLNCKDEVDLRNFKRWHGDNCVGIENRWKTKVTKRKVRVASGNKSRNAWSDKANEKRSKKLKGLKRTEQQKLNMSISGKKRWEKCVDMFKCVNCGLESKIKVNIMRWHNDNCKKAIDKLN